MVQRLFTDVINDAIWFMNIHEQNHPWFLAGPKLDLSSGFSPEAFPINGYAARQRRFDNGVSLSIHKTVEVFNSFMTLEITTNRYGARPVRTHQASAVPGSLPRKSPANATGGTLVSSCGVRGRTRKATGRKNINSKLSIGCDSKCHNGCKCVVLWSVRVCQLRPSTSDFNTQGFC
jgi:hypothetical protein